MAKFVTPKVFVIAETKVDQHGLLAALSHLGVPNWASDAHDDASLLVEFSGKLCYMSFDTALNQNLTKVGTRTNHQYIQEGIVANKHGSVLEHASISMLITDVSRVVTHELVRHRAGTAYSQTSGRYVRTGEVQMYLPSDIAASPEATAIFEEAMQQMEMNTQRLANATGVKHADFALKKKLTSAFRRIVGNGASNHIVLTGNHRAFRHMIEMRTSPHAEEEIRVVFAEVSRILRQRYPAIYADALVSKVDGIEVTEFAHEKV